MSGWGPVVVVVIALLRGIVLPPEPFVDWTSDEVYFVSLVQARQDPELFANDELFQAYRPAFPVAYLAFLQGVVRLLGSMDATLRWVPALWLTIYLLGVYFLTRRLTRSVLAGVVVAFLASHVWATPFMVGLGVLPGRLYPRDVTTAALPWLLLLLGHSRRMTFLAAGLLAAIHPVSAPQIAVLLAGWVIADPDRTEGRPPPIRDLVLAPLLFLLGALPYLIALLRLPDLTPPELDLVRFRMPYVLPPDLANLAAFFLLQLGPVALLGGVGLARGRLAPRARRALLALAATALLFMLVTPLAAAIPRLLALQPMRAAQYLYLPCLIGFGALMSRLLASRRRGATALALILFLLIANQARPLAEPARIAQAAGLRGMRSGELISTMNRFRPLDALGRLAARAGFRPPPPPFLLDTDRDTMARVLSASSVDVEGDRTAFLDLADFALEQCDAGDIFLVPPLGLDHFRVHAKRGVYVTWKDGGVILFSREYAQRWRERFLHAVDLYARHDVDGFRQLLQSGEVQYVVCESRRPRLMLPFVHRNERFIVYGPGGHVGAGRND